jgi:hypothetical protein
MLQAHATIATQHGQKVMLTLHSNSIKAKQRLNTTG